MTKEKSGTRVHLLIKNIPINIKAQFHAHCVKRGTNMTQALIEHMKQIAMKTGSR